MHDGEVTVATQTSQKRADLIGRERLDDRVRLLDSDLANARRQPMNAERVVTTRPLVVRRRSQDAERAVIEVAAGLEAKEEADRTEPAIDRTRCGPDLLLIGDEVDEVGRDELVETSLGLQKPTVESDEIEGVRANGERRETARTHGIEKALDVGVDLFADHDLDASIAKDGAHGRHCPHHRRSSRRPPRIVWRS